MTPSEETAYTQGERAVWLNLLKLALRNLDYKDHEISAARLVAEREAAIQSLRSLCRDYGDNEWPDNLHLQDIITKHLEDHLRSR